MTMLQRLGRLFVIKTRFEAYVVTYAIAVGAVDRGQHYLQQFPGWFGVAMALACTGVVFLAGAKLLDSVRPEPAPALAGSPAWKRSFSRSRPRRLRRRSGATSPASRRKD